MSNRMRAFVAGVVSLSLLPAMAVASHAADLAGSNAGKITFAIPQDVHVTIAIDDVAACASATSSPMFRSSRARTRSSGMAATTRTRKYRRASIAAGTLSRRPARRLPRIVPVWQSTLASRRKRGRMDRRSQLLRCRRRRGRPRAAGLHGGRMGARPDCSRPRRPQAVGQALDEQTPLGRPDALATVGQQVFATSYPDMNTVWEIDPASGESWFVVELKDLPQDQVNTGRSFAGAERSGAARDRRPPDPGRRRIVRGRPVRQGTADLCLQHHGCQAGR